MRISKQNHLKRLLQTQDVLQRHQGVAVHPQETPAELLFQVL